MISPNRQQQHQLSSPPPRISTCSSMLSGSESSGSYSSSSSAGCSSIETGAVNNQNDMLNTVGINSSKKKALLKSNFLDNEVGHGLLNNIHKMQSLLEEYQKSLTSLEFEKADKQNEIDILQKRLKARGETEGKETKQFKYFSLSLFLSNVHLLHLLYILLRMFFFWTIIITIF